MKVSDSREELVRCIFGVWPNPWSRNYQPTRNKHPYRRTTLSYLSARAIHFFDWRFLPSKVIGEKVIFGCDCGCVCLDVCLDALVMIEKGLKSMY